MEDSNIRKWIEKELRNGENPRELKEALLEEGYKPSIVDEVKQETNHEKTTNNTEEIKQKIQKSETITEKLEKEIKKEWKPRLAIIIVIATVATGTILATPITNTINNTDKPIQEKTGQTDQTEKQNKAGNTTTIKLSNGVAKPSRPSITPEENIKFQNKENYKMKIVFESEKENLQIPAQDSKTTNLNSLTYYTAKPAETTAEQISGSIIVQ
ncbi:hypothetical protein [Candidatus Nanohalobium constans]|uniref:Uncharacterized protein n=1 Tax=Candidatus Nanohalobium constans TaxID=2565781 RepID=A0A5Q0UFZ6_9ARCH|nr:hypothetical protein [Candidatus Nanohalobium constans]QGA80321.1 hypothetical protein LC1Nh_0420 [Candidatus Nanohalobium constans]